MTGDSKNLFFWNQNLEDIEFVAECKETNERVAFALGDLYGYDDETVYLDTSLYYESFKKVNWPIIVSEHFCRRVNPDFNVHIRTAVDLEVKEPIKLLSCKTYSGFRFSAVFSDGITRTGCLRSLFRPWDETVFGEEKFKLAKEGLRGLVVGEEFISAKALLRASKEYVHYGGMADEYDVNRFEEVRNNAHMTKPFGGFWASPSSPWSYGWKWFCEKNEYAPSGGLDQGFCFCLDVGATVFRIETVKDFQKLPKIEEKAELLELIDFEECRRQGIDAIEYDYSASHSRRKYDERYTIEDEEALDRLLCGWDCDSILILNPAVIVRESMYTGKTGR